MHVLTATRYYLGMTQAALAKAAGISQPDLSEIETREPYGRLAKFQRLCQYLGLPLEAIAKNDFTYIPESFFEKHPAPVYTSEPTTPDLWLGRQGEEFILQREQARLEESFPTLAKFVLPFFKMKGSFPGYDILSFDNEGKPIAIEVKTSVFKSECFYLSSNELSAAKQLTESGKKYIISYISSWGTPQQTVTDYDFDALQMTHRMDPLNYMCRPKSRPKTEPITGLAYFRKKQGYRQIDFAELMGINACEWNIIERGHQKPSIGVLIRASKLLHVTLDELVEQYQEEAADEQEK